MSLELHQYRKALGTALERLWTLNLSSSLLYTPPHHCRLPEPTDGQQDTHIYAYRCTNIPLCPIAPSLHISSGTAVFVEPLRRYRVHLRLTLYSFSFHPSGSLSYRRSCLIVVHVLSSFIAHHHHPTPTRRHTPAYLIFPCYKPALKANVLFFFSHVFLHPSAFFLFCYNNGGLVRKYLYFAISGLYFSAGEERFVFMFGEWAGMLEKIRCSEEK
jgi:hypothetical protein